MWACISSFFMGTDLRVTFSQPVTGLDEWKMWSRFPETRVWDFIGIEKDAGAKRPKLKQREIGVKR